jgi:hypothetical protein
MAWRIGKGVEGSGRSLFEVAIWQSPESAERHRIPLNRNNLSQLSLEPGTC